MTDPVLKSIADHLKRKYRCHTAILYGSRARGSATSTSDYDVIGIRRSGARTRVAAKKNGFYWDLFVYPEQTLRKLNEQHLAWKDAQILFEKDRFGRDLILRIRALLKKPYKPTPRDEIVALKVWSQKQLERCQVSDVHGLYRRAELHSAAIGDYFIIRKKRFWGPKAGLQWLEENDSTTFSLFDRAFRKPSDIQLLRKLISRVYQV